MLDTPVLLRDRNRMGWNYGEEVGGNPQRSDRQLNFFSRFISQRNLGHFGMVFSSVLSQYFT